MEQLVSGPIVVDSPVASDRLPGAGLTELTELVETSGLCRVHVIAWRDLDDPEAGGSEIHAHELARRWAAAGVDVTMRTSTAVGQRGHAVRSGYSVIRRAGRMSVFPRTAVSEVIGRTGPRDGLVEVWNGMPFFSPLWARGPRIAIIHHVHAEMWHLVLPPRLAKLGELLERRVAPPLYRTTKIVTPSESSRDEIVTRLHLPAENITVAHNGVEAAFRPGGVRNPTPLIVSVGRLVPVKRLPQLIQSVAPLRARHPQLEMLLVGDGYERAVVEREIQKAGASGWIKLEGHVNPVRLVELYQRAWVVASASLREGWGMTLSEAAACGTPSVATRIAGHVDVVRDGITGLLVDDPAGLTAALDRVLSDTALRESLGRAALLNSKNFSWDTTATTSFRVLADEAARRSLRPRRGPGTSGVR